MHWVSPREGNLIKIAPLPLGLTSIDSLTPHRKQQHLTYQVNGEEGGGEEYKEVLLTTNIELLHLYCIPISLSNIYWWS